MVSLGGKGSISREETQRLKVTLSPMDRRTGNPAWVSDEGPE